MREVESEVIRADIRTFLLDMGSENFAESLVEKVGGSMGVRDFKSSFSVYVE